MLVLSCRNGESLVFLDWDREIEVVVLRSGRSVSLGIKAPADVKVLRSELVGKNLDVKG